MQQALHAIDSRGEQAFIQELQALADSQQK
jgi:hypothetical protein